MIDNSGTVRVDGGTLLFGDGLDWKASSGVGEFRAAAPTALVLFAGPFHTDSGVTNLFTGPGTNQWQVGATVDGTAQVGAIDPTTQSPMPGNLNLMDSVSGAGRLQVIASQNQAGLLSWINGTLSVTQVNVANGGSMLIADGPGTGRHLAGCELNNSGHCVWLSQGGVVGGGGAAFINAAGGVLDIQTDTTLALDSLAPVLAFNNAGTFIKSSGNGITSITSSFTNSGSFEIKAGTVTFQNTWLQTLGTTIVDAGTVLGGSTLQVQGGQLSGTGTIAASVANSAIVSPGALPGVLSLAPGKDYQQTGTGTLVVELGGHSPGVGYDQLIVGGNADLAGRLQVRLINGLAPQPGDAFEILTCSTQTGAFSSINSPSAPDTVWSPRYNGTNVVLVLANKVTLSPPTISGNTLSMSFPTTPGRVYVVQASDTLTPPNWQPLTTINGDGTIQTVSDTLNRAQRFYRLSVQ